MKTVLITGSTRGIGLATAEVFAQNGYNIVLNYLNNEALALKIAQDFTRKYQVKVLTCQCNIGVEDEVKDMVKKIKDTFGQIDCLVNNAGIALDNELTSKSKEEFNQVLETNLIGPFLVTKYVQQIMGKGSIINVSSNGATTNGYIEAIDYDASKAGLIALTHDFAKALAPKIRVNCILPGWVKTDMNQDLSEKFQETQKNKCLLKRFAKPEEIAQVIYFLANDVASFVNDAIINVDGGLK